MPNQQLGWLVFNDENDDGFVAPEKLAGCFFQSIVRQVKDNFEEYKYLFIQWIKFRINGNRSAPCTDAPEKIKKFDENNDIHLNQ